MFSSFSFFYYFLIFNLTETTDPATESQSPAASDVENNL
jgi:hypothetical protein